MCLITPLASSKPNPISRQLVITLKGAPVCLIKNGWHIRKCGVENPQMCIYPPRPLSVRKMSGKVTVINGNVQMTQTEFFCSKTRANSKWAYSRCVFAVKTGFLRHVIGNSEQKALVLYFGGMLRRASLQQCGPPWFHYDACSKAAGFTWYNLPVINSLERVQDLRGLGCFFFFLFLAGLEESSLCPRCHLLVPRQRIGYQLLIVLIRSCLCLFLHSIIVFLLANV